MRGHETAAETGFPDENNLRGHGMGSRSPSRRPLPGPRFSPHPIDPHSPFPAPPHHCPPPGPPPQPHPRTSLAQSSRHTSPRSRSTPPILHPPSTPHPGPSAALAPDRSYLRGAAAPPRVAGTTAAHRTRKQPKMSDAIAEATRSSPRGRKESKKIGNVRAARRARFLCWSPPASSSAVLRSSYSPA